MNLPFSWDTLPRYTFCGNETKNYTGFPLRDSAVEYISTKGGPINLIGDHSSYRYPAETYVSQQAQVMLAKNPSQRQWAYYAIDLVRTTFETGAYMMNHSDECLFKDASGVPVPRPVYGFDGGAGSCGVEKWLEGVQMMVEKGGISGIFLDGFQGCDPFFPRLGNGSFGVGCTRICGHHTLANGSKVPVDCTPESIAAWNKGLRDAMWRLKKLLGENGTLICNSTPGPYTCGNAKDPITDCPCDGTKSAQPLPQSLLLKPLRGARARLDPEALCAAMSVAGATTSTWSSWMRSTPVSAPTRCSPTRRTPTTSRTSSTPSQTSSWPWSRTSTSGQASATAAMTDGSRLILP